MRRLLAWMLVFVLTLLCGCSGDSLDRSKETETSKETITTVSTGNSTKGETAVTTTTETVTVTEAPSATADDTTTVTAGTVATTASTGKMTTKKTTTTKATTATTKRPVAAGLELYGPADGTVIDPMAPIIREYLAIDNAQEAADFWVVDYYDNDNGASFTITWRSKATALYQVTWADNAALKNARSMMVSGGSFGITGLPHGSECYFQVKDISNDLESEVRCVRILDGQVRWIDAEGSRNVRDIGGWKTESGKTVRYGMLYRGACIDGYNGIALTSFGKKQFREMLGIKTQIDLRGKDDGNEGAQANSDFGGKYVKATFNQYDYIFTDSHSREALGKIFDVLSDEANYPIYFHCNAGSDRTGTLAFIINGLLGVSHEDLTRDFELTGFSIGKRLRSELKTDNSGASWNPSGVMQAGGGNYIAWGPLYNTMMTNYGTGDGKLSSAIENFLKTECGVTQAEIDAVCRLMLE